MKKLIYLFVGLLVLVGFATSCEKNGMCNCGSGPTNLNFALINQDSVNLFDAEHFDKERVRLYKEQGGTLVEVWDSIQDYPSGVFWDTIDGQTFNLHSLFLDESTVQTIYVSYFPNDIDTIAFVYNKENNDFMYRFNNGETVSCKIFHSQNQLLLLKDN